MKYDKTKAKAKIQLDGGAPIDAEISSQCPICKDNKARVALKVMISAKPEIMFDFKTPIGHLAPETKVHLNLDNSEMRCMTCNRRIHPSTEEYRIASDMVAKFCEGS